MVAGSCSLHLWCDPESTGERVAFPGSPFPMQISAGPASTAVSRVDGWTKLAKEEKTMIKGQPANVCDPNSIWCGEMLSFKPQMFDAFRNPAQLAEGVGGCRSDCSSHPCACASASACACVHHVQDRKCITCMCKCMCGRGCRSGPTPHPTDCVASNLYPPRDPLSLTPIVSHDPPLTRPLRAPQSHPLCPLPVSRPVPPSCAPSSLPLLPPLSPTSSPALPCPSVACLARLHFAT